MRLWYRAALGGIVAGSLAFLGTVLINQGGAGMDAATLATIIGPLAWLGAFVGAFGFQRGSQAWNNTLDSIDETFSS
jgi:hypothetical protein